VDVAINAFAKVKEEIPEAEFHIYGEGPAKDSLIKLADSLRLSDRVIFHNSLPIEEIVQVMADTDLAVEPKRAGSEFGNEALSMKILEFMALGVPLVVSRTKIHEFYYSDALVKYYGRDDKDELARSIVLLKRNSAMRDQLVANALRYVEANNWDVEKGQYLRMVDSLAQSKVRSRNTQRVAGVR
jgi:glycosyltransferase involved in cell wall biosynthesis